MAYFEVQKALKEQEKAKQDKIFLPAGVVEKMIDIINKAGSNKDISFIGLKTVDWGNINLSGGDGVGNLLKDSYKYFEESKTPPIVTFGNLETAHMLRLKKAFENLEERMALKRKSDALKRKSDKLTLQRNSLARLKIDILKLIGEIDKK